MPTSPRSPRSTGPRTTARREGGRSAPAPRKGGAGPTIAAAGVVVGVIVLAIALFSGGGKKPSAPPSPPPMAPAPVPPRAEAPVVPSKPPPPALSDAIRKEAGDLTTKAKDLASQGEKIYEEAMAAKRAGDEETWQAKLEEASVPYYEIQDLWNELIVQMPTSDDWPDAEDVANYHLGTEGDLISKALSRLHDIQKQRRSN